MSEFERSWLDESKNHSTCGSKRCGDDGQSGLTRAYIRSRMAMVDRGPQQNGKQNDCQSCCHNLGFVVDNYSPCGPHAYVQYDPPQTTERAEFTLVSTVTPLTSHACTPSSPVAVVQGSINVQQC
ncbi:hypothetical protein TNCV_4792331 [Trichonephila clavipes]|nr:hypothetical protein TNCV_4792331 [Trichonephila clavipes]